MSETEQQGKEIKMEEMGSALYDSAKAGVDGVIGGVTGLFKYSWMGFQYAAEDIRALASKVGGKADNAEGGEAEAAA